jgi:tetraacyldisaccharide 4'-kinase
VSEPTEPRWSRTAFAAALAPLSAVYGAVIRARNARFDRGLGVHRVPRPVISVGNVTTGGTGKTPMVMWIVERMLARGRRPVIAMRGYGARPGDAGDEELEYREKFGASVPIVAHPDRVAALNRFFADADRAEFDAVVLDDAFQHRRIHRDLDLVLIDATADTLHDRLLPAGRLREPLGGLRRAHGVVVTRAERVDEALAREIERFHGRPPLAWATHVWSHVHVHESGTTRSEPVEWLQGRRVVVMLGVGNPGAIERQLQRAGAVITRRIAARDHAKYHDDRVRAVLASAAGAADAIVITSKDWMKIRSLPCVADAPVPIASPGLTIEFVAGQPALVDAIDRAASARAGGGYTDSGAS